MERRAYRCLLASLNTAQKVHNYFMNACDLFRIVSPHYLLILPVLT